MPSQNGIFVSVASQTEFCQNVLQHRCWIRVTSLTGKFKCCVLLDPSFQISLIPLLALLVIRGHSSNMLIEWVKDKQDTGGLLNQTYKST